MAGTGNQHFLGLRIAADGDGRVFVANLGQRRGQLVLVALGFGFERKADGGLRDGHRGQLDILFGFAQGVAGVGLLELGKSADVTGGELGHVLEVFPLGD